MSNAAKAIAAIIAAIVFFVVAFFALNYFLQGTASFRGETDKREQVEANGSFRIAAYDRFFNQCARVQTIEDQIDIQLLEREDASDVRKQQIDANVTASRSQRASLIRQYNADASKDYTSGQFIDSDLPFSLNPDAKETTCSL